MSRQLEKLIHADPTEPVRVADCIALGAWRRFDAGHRGFSPEMWQVIEEVIADPAGAKPSPPDSRCEN